MSHWGPTSQFGYKTTAFRMLNPTVNRQWLDGNANEWKPGTFIQCDEAPNSPGALVYNRDTGATSSRELKITGTLDRDLVLEAINGWLNVNGLFYDRGIPLKSKSLSADPSGGDVWTCSLEYGDAQDEKWIDEVQITTTGGSAHIDYSFLAVDRVSTIYGLPWESTFGKIGIDQEGKPEGVDVKRPTMQINVTLNWGFNDFDYDYLYFLYDHSPAVNAYPFWGFPTGMLLFEGVNVDRVSYNNPGDNSTMYRWRVQYVISVEANTEWLEPVININTGEYVGVEYMFKYGWDYRWRTFFNANFFGRATQVCRQVNMDRVYVGVDFAQLGLPNNLLTLDEYIYDDGTADWNNSSADW